jgi:hypothetical protein
VLDETPPLSLSHGRVFAESPSWSVIVFPTDSDALTLSSFEVRGQAGCRERRKED